MKTLFRTNKSVVIAIGVTACAVILLCAQYSVAGARAHKVEFTQGMVLIHPTAKLSPADEQAMNDALRNYDKRLYKIETVKSGQVQSQGKLADMGDKDPITGHVLVTPQFRA